MTAVFSEIGIDIKYKEILGETVIKLQRCVQRIDFAKILVIYGAEDK